MGSSPTLPTTFTVGVTTPGPFYGGARLIIAPGSLVCVPGRLTGAVSGMPAVTHASGSVEVYFARLLPPWMSLGVPVRDRDDAVIVALPLFSRQRLLRSLREAGFDVIERITWFDRGMRRMR